MLLPSPPIKRPVDTKTWPGVYVSRGERKLATIAASLDNCPTTALSEWATCWLPSAPLRTWIFVSPLEPVTFIYSKSTLIIDLSSSGALSSIVNSVCSAFIAPFKFEIDEVNELDIWFVSLSTNNVPTKLSSEDESSLLIEVIFINSFEKPWPFTFFANIISSTINPLAFSTTIKSSACATDCVTTVEFASHNWPPTAFTVSFSNTAVLNVPRILIFSNSAKPFAFAEIIHPENCGS